MATMAHKCLAVVLRWLLAKRSVGGWLLSAGVSWLNLTCLCSLLPTILKQMDLPSVDLQYHYLSVMVANCSVWLLYLNLRSVLLRVNTSTLPQMDQHGWRFRCLSCKSWHHKRVNTQMRPHQNFWSRIGVSKVQCTFVWRKIFPATKPLSEVPDTYWLSPQSSSLQYHKILLRSQNEV